MSLPSPACLMSTAASQAFAQEVSQLLQTASCQRPLCTTQKMENNKWVRTMFNRVVACHTLMSKLPPQRRQWHPTPVLLPGKSHEQRSLVGCSPWGREEWNTTEPTSLSLFTFMHWRRKWQPTPVFLPGESQGQGTLVGCRLWGRTESDTTEAT